MKKLIFTTLSLLILLSFLLVSCENEEILQLEESAEIVEERIPIGLTTFDELPDLKGSLLDISKKSRAYSSSREGANWDAPVMDETKILSITDSIGNTSYSIRLYVPDTPYNIFHNIVVKKRPDGGYNDPMVLQYEISEDYYETYTSTERQNAPFKGTIKVFNTDTFFSESLSFERDKAYDWISLSRNTENPCSSVNSNGSSGGGGSGGTQDEGGNDDHVGDHYDSYGFGDAPWGYYGGPGGGGGDSDLTTVLEIGDGDFQQSGTEGYHTAKYNELSKTNSGQNSNCPTDELLFLINEEDTVILVPSCQSFEYANGSLVKAAGVSNINNSFITGGFEADGSPYYAEIELNITESYFSMPKYWTNGKAANATAFALLAANAKTEAWFEANYRASGIQLAIEWEKNIKEEMRAIGGSWSKSAPHSIPNLAPYVRDWVWSITDCS